MIHKNIYSNRIKNVDQVDPYTYEIEGDEMVNSYLMLLSKVDEDILVSSLVDFCETKSKFISNSLEELILHQLPYNKDNCIFDLRGILKFYDTIDIIDFFDILIANFNMQIKNDQFYYIIKNLAKNQPLHILISQKNTFIDLLNKTFEHINLGFSVVNDVIATKKSDFLHQEAIVKPLTLLANEEFKGALEEFTNAIDKYTKSDYENTILEACKAFESTIKSILDKLKVTYDKSLKINESIKLLKDNNLFAPFLENMYSNINGILTGGINKIRNEKSGHGDGLVKNDVERSYASFALNLAGSSIVFLLDRYYDTN